MQNGQLFFNCTDHCEFSLVLSNSKAFKTERNDGHDFFMICILAKNEDNNIKINWPGPFKIEMLCFIACLLQRHSLEEIKWVTISS